MSKQGNDWYFGIGGLLGIGSGIAVFIGAWVYCTITYGFLFGFGFGWLPSIIAAILIGGAIWLLWPFVLIAVAGLILWLTFGQ